jgi:hypothetical protein
MPKATRLLEIPSIPARPHANVMDTLSKLYVIEGVPGIFFFLNVVGPNYPDLPGEVVAEVFLWSKDEQRKVWKRGLFKHDLAMEHVMRVAMNGSYVAPDSDIQPE